MALGGGTFTTQNKVIPGAYINFVSASKATKTLSERGIVAMPIELDWGIDDEVFVVENADFQKKALELFGYDYSSAQMKGLRDLFLNAKTAYFYRVNSGTKASNDLATAKYTGVRGNKISLVIAKNAENEALFDVATYMAETKVDVQTVSSASELVDNTFVVFNKEGKLAVSVGMPLAEGANGDVTGMAYQNALDQFESYTFNVLACTTTDESIKGLLTKYTKRLRDEVGVKFQTVLYHYAADYEGIINVKNAVTDQDEKESNLVYWVAGICAACQINKVNTNKVYDGEFSVAASFTQAELEKAIEKGEFTFHRVNQEIRVLEDINSFVNATADRGEDFKNNQTIRILDQIGNDLAALFNESYLGKVRNNEAGRISFWKDVVKYDKELEKLEAIETFNTEDVTVEIGEDKKSIVVTNPVQIINCMSKLYMTIIVA